MSAVKSSLTIEPEYYSVSIVITKNRTINYIIGGRGIGKTYGFKKSMIKRAIRNPETSKFIYLRRQITEVDAIVDWFGTMRSDPDFDEYLFDMKGRDLLYALKSDEEPNWIKIGMIYALREQRKIKSQEYPDYDRMIYDEWLAEGPTDFLRNEPMLLQNMCDSVFRNRDFRVYCLANSTMLHNPYFQYFDFYPNLAKEFSYDNDRGQLIQLIPPGSFREYRETTAMGKWSKGTAYEDYAMGNKFKDNDDSLIEPRDPRAKLNAVVKIDTDMIIGLWSNRDGRFWFSEKYNEGHPQKYAMEPELVDEQYRPASVLYTSTMFTQLRLAREWGDIRFDSKKAKGKAIKIVQALSLFK